MTNNRINELRKKQLSEENAYGLDRIVNRHSLIIIDSSSFDCDFTTSVPKYFAKELENAIGCKSKDHPANQTYMKKLKEFFELYDNIRVPKEVVQELRACFDSKNQKEYVNNARRELLEVIISRPRILKLTDEENKIFLNISDKLKVLKKNFKLSSTDYSILCYCISSKDTNKALLTNDIPLIKATSSAARTEEQTLTIYSSIGNSGIYHESRIFKNGRTLFSVVPNKKTIKPINRLYKEF